jgi:hypothetical protein
MTVHHLPKEVNNRCGLYLEKRDQIPRLLLLFTTDGNHDHNHNQLILCDKPSPLNYFLSLACTSSPRRAMLYSLAGPCS